MTKHHKHSRHADDAHGDRPVPLKIAFGLPAVVIFCGFIGAALPDVVCHAPELIVAPGEVSAGVPGYCVYDKWPQQRYSSPPLVGGCNPTLQAANAALVSITQERQAQYRQCLQTKPFSFLSWSDLAATFRALKFW